MPSDQQVGLQNKDAMASGATWRDGKRYFWLLGSIIPAMVALSWFAVWATGLGVFWWAGPILTFGIIPVLDHIVGSDAENPPESALAWLQDDPYYRWHRQQPTGRNREKK